MIEPVVIGPCTLFNADCRDVLPLLEGVDAVVTDPPYGIDYGNAGGFCESSGWNDWKGQAEWDAERPDKATFDAVLKLSVPSVIWGGNYFTDYLPPRMGWMAWDKGQRDFTLADFELAWTSEDKAARCVVYSRGKANREERVHPTQKPAWVMEQCIHYLDRGRKRQLEAICDPFMGSGTTGIACIRLGRAFIGIEREPHYFEIACRRIRDAVAAEKSSLFPAGEVA